MRILLAESQAERLASLQRAIAAYGYDVTPCSRGDDAWRAWGQGRHPLLVLSTDLAGLDGLELCRRVRHKRGDQPYYVLLLVSKQMPDSLTEALQAGADDIVVRPIDDDELGMRLRLAERRIAEITRAREEHHSYMELLAQAPDLIQTVALDGAMLYANRAWFEALGYSEGELGGLSFFDVVVPKERDAMRKAFRWLRRGRGIGHLRTELLARDGRRMKVEGSMTPRFRGRAPTSVRVILRDVSRRLRAETMLRGVLEGTSATTGRDFFRSLVRHLSRALEVEHAFVAQHVPGSEARVRTLAIWSRDQFHPNRSIDLRRMPRLAGRGDAGQRPQDPAVVYPGADTFAEAGAESYLGVPVLNASGASIGVLCVLADGPMRPGPDALRILATFAERAGAEMERKLAEAERRALDRRMQESQKLESMGVLAGGIAHDFNNLLTSILGYAGLAQSLLPSSAPGAQYLTDIEKASRRAADLAMQMLAYSGKGQFVIQPLDLGDVVDETTRLLRTDITTRGVSLECRLGEGTRTVEGDITQIRQVLMNLILNAAQAMEPAGGVVEVSVGEELVARDELRHCYVGRELQPGRYVVLRVRDSGCGMNPDVAARIFDPFFTTKTGGRGLGLAAVVGIVRGHRGALSVESRPGEGTRMSVILPPSKRAAVTEAESAHTLPADGDGLILVVDDEESIRRLTRDLLVASGYQVLTAANGREGVDLFRARAHEIDAVLLDMTMPVMGGVEAFRGMREIRPDIRVVISSGYTEREAVNRFDGDAPASFIQKPYAASELLRQLADVLARSTIR